jgi:hypothetical protein
LSTQNGGASADNAGAGDSASQNGSDNSQGSAGGKEEFVSKADHLRALQDLKRFKEEAKTLKEQQQAAKEAEMRKNQEWEALAKQKEEEAKAARTDAEKLKANVLNDRKYTALREHATKLGLRQEALSDLDMVDLSDIEVEYTSTGRVNVQGADRAAEKLKAMKPHWFGSKTPPNVDTTDLRVNPGATVTVKQLQEAQKKAQKTGDTSEYNALAKKFQAQKKR